MRPSSALSFVVLLAGFSGNVLAQANNNNNQNTGVSNKPAPTNAQNNGGDGAPPALSTGSPAKEDPKPSETKENPKPSETNKGTTPEKSSEKAPPVPEPTEEAPSLDSATKTTSGPGVVVTGAAGGGGSDNSDDPPPPKYTPPDNSRYKIPQYDPPAVPNTKNAPYMQRSDLPEGTVFIVVGAVLGLIGLIAFAWRMVVAWQLRRSIRRANMVAVDSKAGLLGRYNAPSTTKKSFYSAGAGSSLSLDHLGSSRTTGLGPTPNASLFFSPTANNNNGGPHQNRASQYLPAGYYAPAASTNVPFNQSRDSLALPRPRPATRDSHIVGTPPASPHLTPQARRGSPGQGHAQALSISSTLDVSGQQGGRTPSTYLEDMLNIPFPEEPGMTPEQVRRSSRRKSGHSFGQGSGSRRL